MNANRANRVAAQTTASSAGHLQTDKSTNWQTLPRVLPKASTGDCHGVVSNKASDIAPRFRGRIN
jgi:hypothetical protein